MQTDEPPLSTTRGAPTSLGLFSMKRVLLVVAFLLILTGVVWFFQGINVLPGSFMTGRPEWAMRGAFAMLAGTGLLVWALRERR